jgi:UDP-N-acetylmuramate dehydrogenase
MSAISIEGTTLVAGAGAECTRMAAEALQAGLTGLEFMHCLPGSAGGAAFMNARAFGQEISGVLDWARVVNRTGNLSRMEVDPSGFAYKHSPFMERGLTVAEVGLGLERGDGKAIEEQMAANETHRRSKGEMDYPCCGCVFKNPTDGDRSAGAIIDSCGLKGLREGGAWVSEKHANFVVHDGGAAPSEIRRLMDRVRATVAERTGRSLAYEVRFLGDW